MDLYRFELGNLYKLDKDKNAYVFVFSSIYADTKELAIQMYESSRHPED